MTVRIIVRHDCPFFRIRLSDDAIESMCLAAVEAYVFGEKRGRKSIQQLETHGYLWGSRKKLGDTVVLQIDRLHTSVSAVRSPDSVQPHVRSAELMNNIVERLAPQRWFLGDFHTHPYSDLAEVKARKGWEFSGQDNFSFIHDDFVWGKAADTPVSIVMTICKLGKVRQSEGATMLAHDLWHFDLGEFRFWIHAAAGYTDQDGTRHQTATDKVRNIFLDLNTRFFNMTGDKIAKHVK